MGSSKIRRAVGAVKDQTTISLAKVGGSTSRSDLDVAIVKATKHDEQPAEEKHVREILSLTSYSSAYVSACINALARRLNKTRNWTVALKTLMLIQRLLSDGDGAYEQEIFFATRRGTRFLNMSDFRDTSRSNSWDLSAFVRTYALYLDERLEVRMQGRRGKRIAFVHEVDDDEEDTSSSVARATPLHEMKMEQVFSRIQHLQQLLERFLACRPTGVAKSSRIVLVALYPLVKDSFQIYYDTTKVLGVLIDRFMELDVPDCVKIYDFFCRTGKQFDELEIFYGWCRDTGIARSSEYPEVEKITQKKLDVMDEFIRDKSALAHRKAARDYQDQMPKEDEFATAWQGQNHKEEEEEEEDMNAMKALPGPEGFEEEEEQDLIQPPPPAEEEDEKDRKPNQHEGDLLNLGRDAEEQQQHGDRLALALFDSAGGGGPSQAAIPAWKAFQAAQQDGSDWEMALVQSASHLSGQQATLGGGFDMLLLDGMYQTQGGGAATSPPTGSASSVALGSAGRPGGMLALPAPPSESEGTSSGSTNNNNNNIDPFAASLAVAPPAYVQMSEMEKKQRLLVQEQLMWQQYARDGMQGQLAISKLQQPQHPNTYNLGH